MRLPTRRIERNTVLYVQRNLPIPGEILVRPGETVAPADIIARAALPSRYAVVNVSRELQISAPDMDVVMQKGVGDNVSAGELLAQSGGKLRLRRRVCRSPVDGVIAAIVGHRVLIETEARWHELRALVHGRVKSVQHTLGVTVSANGDAIDGACGFGANTFGKLTAWNAAEDVAEMVVLMSESVTAERLAQLHTSGVRGIITGNVAISALDVLPAVQIPVIATAGIGTGHMADEMHALLAENIGKSVTLEISGVTGRPRIIFSGKKASSPRQFDTGSLGRKPNNVLARMPSVPQAGWGTVVSDSGTLVLVEFGDEKISVPWQNVELLP